MEVGLWTIISVHFAENWEPEFGVINVKFEAIPDHGFALILYAIKEKCAPYLPTPPYVSPLLYNDVQVPSYFVGIVKLSSILRGFEAELSEFVIIEELRLQFVTTIELVKVPKVIAEGAAAADGPVNGKVAKFPPPNTFQT